MARKRNWAIWARIWRDRKGQDLIEYALLAGFVAVSAGAVMPNIADEITQVFSKVNSVLIRASAVKPRG